MRTFVAEFPHTHSWCVKPVHWVSGKHPLGNLTDLLNPVWHPTCQLNTVVMPDKMLLSIDEVTTNGPHLID